MASKTVTISSDHDLEDEIEKFQEETGLTRAEFHRRSARLFIGNHERKAKINTNKQGDE